MSSEKLPWDGMENKEEKRTDTAGVMVKLVRVKQNQMSAEAADGQCLRGSGWGVARGEKPYLIPCCFPSGVSRHKDIVIIKWLTICWSSLSEGNPWCAVSPPRPAEGPMAQIT